MKYELPEEPEGPLYETDGHKWVRDGDYWEDDYGHRLAWFQLLRPDRGPLTDVVPDLGLGEVRWHHTRPDLFAVRGWAYMPGETSCWWSCLGTKLPDDVVESDYTRTEPAEDTL